MGGAQPSRRGDVRTNWNAVCLLDNRGSKFQVVRSAEVLEDGHLLVGSARAEILICRCESPQRENLTSAWACEIFGLDARRHAVNNLPNVRHAQREINYLGGLIERVPFRVNRYDAVIGLYLKIPSW
jgi:hypothetical protein